MDYKFSDSVSLFQSSAVREILKLTQGGNVISFAGGLPCEELFPLGAVQSAFEKVFSLGSKALQYGLTEGFLPLREAIAERMLTKSITVQPEDILLTSGSQQAIDLLSRVYLDPGDTVFVQEPTYLAALQVFRARGAKIISVAGDEHGMDMDDLASKIKLHQPKLLYVNPTFSNPTGYVWSVEKRSALLKLCHDSNLLILEDDPYGELQYAAIQKYPSIFSMDRHPHGSSVVYTGTFSKTVAPALRTGWVLGDPSIIRAMTKAKQAADLHSGSLDQQALFHLLRDFDLEGHILKIREVYGRRMKEMVQLLEPLRAEGLSWNEPQGGMFFWVELPEAWNAEQLLRLAVTKGVAFVPGASFYAERPKFNTLRMNFTHASSEQLALGMDRFDAAIRELKEQLTTAAGKK